MRLYVRKIEEYADADTLLLEEQRRRRLSGFRNENACLQSIAAGMLLREALSDYGYDVGEKPLELVYEENGKPSLAGETDPHFCLSHSGSLVVCAVDDVPVGVDVQVVRKISKRVANRILAPDELGKFNSFSAKNESTDRYLTVLWTEKESIAKLIGKGLSADFRNLSACDYRLYTLMHTVGSEEYVITVACSR
ncbi:MAG: 4'-phosphopantetheinyl transferase superfamily protein [Lachnospiraceae bacterium]|nr:4'-phosphopantetheinyl transferase superfamily protein [Lachnospiraceae bacterium]